MFKRIKNSYIILSQIIFSTIFLFLIVNTTLWVAYKFQKSTDIIAVETNPFLKRYGTSVSELFPNLDVSDIRKLLSETWSFPLQYDAVAQFREYPRKGRFVNVSDFGFRKNGTVQVWPPDKNSKIIYVFGGSTTFGYGVADNETIPAILESQLEPNTTVYNFGRGFFDTNHELLLFVKLLFENNPPHLAIFIDGTNEFRHGGEPRLWHTRRLRDLDKNLDDTSAMLARLLSKLPITKFLNWFHVQLFGYVSAGENIVSSEQHQTAERALARYLNNKKFIKMIAKAARIDTLFIWQPIPTVDYITSLIPFNTFGELKEGSRIAMYALVRNGIKSGEIKDVVWCASVGQNVNTLLYVDSVHYSPKMNELVATCISEHVLSQPLS